MPNLLQDPQISILQKFAREKKMEVFLVGGFLRDYLLDIPTRDYDFALSKGAIPFARSFARKIHAAFVLLDQDRGCGRVAKNDSAGVATYDFADFRAPGLKSDLAHRDFTVNTLYLRLSELTEASSIKSLIRDERGGLKDLKARRVRMVSTSSFREDPLRLLRAYSLQARFGFSIEAQTLRQLKKECDLIRQVARERILDELFKILESPRAAQTLKSMDQSGLLQQIIPQVAIMVGVTQGGYHHLDVWPHSLETVAQLEKVFEEKKSNPEIQEYLNESLAGTRTRRGLLKLSALLHDIGKPETRKKEQGRMSFHGHEHVGQRIARPIAKLLKLSTRERNLLENHIVWHLRPGYLSNFKRPSEKAFFRYFRDTGDEGAAIALLSMADQRSTRGPLTTQADQKHHARVCEELIKRFFEIKNKKPLIRLLTGHDVMKTFKLKPSPFLGEILKKLEEAQAMGTVTTQEEALNWVGKLIKSHKGNPNEH